jgi:diguanylate cyclase (GGDEF)-like protein
MSKSLKLKYSKEWIGRVEGLPSSQIHDVVYANAHIWMSTASGLVSYKGSAVDVFDQKHGLLTHGLRRLVSENTNLLVCSDHGVNIFCTKQNRSIDKLSTVDLGLGWCQGIAPLNANDYLIACARGVKIWDPSEFQVRDVNSDINDDFIVNIVGFGRGKALIQANDSGLWIYQNNEITRFVHAGDVSMGNINAISAQQNVVWVAAENYLIELTKSFEIKNCYKLPSTIKTAHAAIIINPKQLILTDQNSLYLLNISAENKLEQRDVIIHDNKVNSLTLDNAGNVWAATESTGLFKFLAINQHVQRFSTGVTNSILSVQLNQSSLLSHQLDKYLTIESSSNHNGLDQEQALNHDAPVLLVGGNKHSYIACKNTLSHAIEIIALKNIACWDLQSSNTLGCWAATSQGLVKIEDVSADKGVFFRHKKIGDGRCLAFLDDDKILYGTVSGLYLFQCQSSKFEALECKVDGSVGYVYSLKKDDFNNYYVATLGNGLWHLDSSSFELERVDPKSSEGNVYCVDLDQKQRLIWVVDNKLYCRDKGNVKLLLETDASVLAWQCLFYNQDLVVLATSSGLQVFSFEQRRIVFNLDRTPHHKMIEHTTARSMLLNQGVLISGLNSGLNQVDLASVMTIPQPVPRICAVKSEYPFILSEEKLTIKQSDWLINIDFCCDWFWMERTLSYQYRLLGKTNYWQDIKGSRLSLTSLNRGQYVLEIRVSNSLSQSNVCHSLLMIEVLPSNYSLFAHYILKPVIEAVSSAKRRFNYQKQLKANYRAMDELVSAKNQELARAEDQLKQYHHNLEEMLTTQSPTRLYNLQYFYELIDSKLIAYGQANIKLSALILSVDNLEEYNQFYGVLAGKVCLQRISLQLNQTLAEMGVSMAQFNGPEFIVCLVADKVLQAETIANQCIAVVKQLKIPHELAKAHGLVTISVGLSTSTLTDPTDQELLSKHRLKLIKSADAALHSAQKLGGDQVCIL